MLGFIASLSNPILFGYLIGLEGRSIDTHMLGARVLVCTSVDFVENRVESVYRECEH